MDGKFYVAICVHECSFVSHKCLVEKLIQENGMTRFNSKIKKRYREKADNMCAAENVYSIHFNLSNNIYCNLLVLKSFLFII